MRNPTVIILLLLLSGGASAQPALFADGFEPRPEVAYTLSLSPDAVLFTAPGETRDLSVEAFDVAGAPVTRELNWRSTQPSVVSVSPLGEVTALAGSGSAQIIVETEGAMPAMALVVIAAPAAGAMLVSDAQVLSGPALVEPNAPYGLGTQYTVELALPSAPAVGQVLLASGEAPIGGRVVSFMAISGGFLVTLEVIPIAEMFDQLELHETLDLSTAPATIDPALTDVYDVVRRVDGSVHLSLKPGVTKTGTSAVFDIDFNKCKDVDFPNFADLLAVDVGPDIGIEHDLNFHLGYGLVNGLEELRVDGFVQGVFEIKPRVASAFQGKVQCRLNIINIAIPFGGPLSWIISGVIPVGLGFDVAGKVTLTEPIGYDLTVSAHASFDAGVVCTAAECQMVAEADADVDGNLRPVIPPDFATLLGSARFEASAHGFAYAEMGIGNPLLASLSFKPIEVLVGLQQSLDLESMASQAGKTDYASGYKLELVASAGATHAINELLSLLQISAPPLTLETKLTLAQSPQGNLTITPASVVAGSDQELGEMATFEVSFQSIDYLVPGNDVVSDVQLFFAVDNGSGGVSLSPGRPGCNIIPAPTGPLGADKGVAGVVFGCQTDFLQQHIGQHQFVAFYTGNLFGLDLPIPLEVAANSTSPLTVTDSSELFVFTFDNGFDGWSDDTSGKDLDEVEWLSFSGNPGGTIKLNGSDFARTENPPEPNSWIYKTLALPSSTGTLSLEARADPNPAGSNDAALRVRLVAGGTIHTLLDWEVLAGPTWQTRSADISAYAGQTVTIYIEQDDDGEGVGEFIFIDNVRIESEVTPPPDPD